MLFGRNKLKKPDRDRFFAAITAEMSLAGRTDIRPTYKAGVVFNPVEATFFENLDSELRDLLRISKASSGTSHEIVNDAHGTRWVVLDDPDFEDLVTTMHMVSETIFEHGYGDRLIAAVLPFDYERKKAYWIYNYKRGRFYPFVLDESGKRDNHAEMRLGTLMEREKLPMEQSLEQWYSLWGIPF